VPLADLGDGAADGLGALVGTWVVFLLGALDGVRVAAALLVEAVGSVDDAAGWVVGEASGIDAEALDGAVDTTFDEVAGEARSGGSFELKGETNAGRATRAGADLKPSSTMMAVIVPSVERTARFMSATEGS